MSVNLPSPFVASSLEVLARQIEERYADSAKPGAVMVQDSPDSFVVKAQLITKTVSTVKCLVYEADRWPLKSIEILRLLRKVGEHVPLPFWLNALNSDNPEILYLKISHLAKQLDERALFVCQQQGDIALDRKNL